MQSLRWWGRLEALVQFEFLYLTVASTVKPGPLFLTTHTGSRTPLRNVLIEIPNCTSGLAPLAYRQAIKNSVCVF
jgi:hypothetical protein